MPRDRLVDLGQAPILVRRLELEPFHPVIDALVCLDAVDSLELREELEHAADLHLLVQAALLGKISDAVRDAGVAVGLAEQLDGAAVRDDDVEEHADGRRLAGAVGPSKP
jgi:hypothetical protein